MYLHQKEESNTKHGNINIYSELTPLTLSMEMCAAEPSPASRGGGQGIRIYLFIIIACLLAFLEGWDSKRGSQDFHSAWMLSSN